MRFLKLTRLIGDSVFVNPACVELVFCEGGGTRICLTGDNYVTVVEPLEEVMGLLDAEMGTEDLNRRKAMEAPSSALV